MSMEITAGGKTFIHQHSAHCESGVASALFRDQGFNISEALVFGIGSGIFFGHLFFVKMVGLPITTYRSQPGAIFRKAGKRLGVKFVTQRFRDPQKGMDALRLLLKEGKIVGMTTNIYWLSYFPNRFRFQFNGHNLIALKEITGGFRISDPVLEYPVDCLAEDLERARFAHGPLEPHGFMYYPQSVPQKPDIKKACIAGMKDTCNMMLRIPIPIFGVSGIRFLAKRIKKSPHKLGFAEACRHLANIVRMQEEIGTGGAGFRFIYAAFLQEAAELFGSAELTDLSKEMTAIGDMWREFAVMSARIIKQRSQTEDTFDNIYDILMECADREEVLFRKLRDAVRKLKA
jgi:hypothetical protein